MPEAPAPLQQTPLHALHLRLGARMVPFAGYAMPVQYPAGLIAEHRHCRRAAALFDVSHMGQLRLVGAEAAAALETLVPVDVVDLAPGRQRYAFFTNDGGGLLDDLMLVRTPGQARDAGFGDVFVVVNAAGKDADLQHLLTHIGHRCRVLPMPERALLALQGPQAAAVMARLHGGVAELAFMAGGLYTLAGADCFVTRSGYTGEDGFEISVPAEAAPALAERLLAQPEVAPAGLGARDTLRLEAGLCLYGQDIDAATSPVEAGLAWAIQKVRRPGGARAGGYPGAAVIEAHLAGAAPSRRVGLLGLERVPVRPGTPLVDAHGHALGRVRSGTLAPTVDQPIAMAYLPREHALPAHEVYAQVRGQRLPMRVTPLPFTPHRYHR
ncbi:MAG: glycine cleavage system aminomethyltransferase GcvT [Burkholderiales bacterium]|nr:glycine cleavage system aminomethyltransferase GcvT [Burkholderiales bacterium]MDE2565728.1 glycine cleavage system aminomethyltransferase GcvT [Burkholderiales bacterium]